MTKTAVGLVIAMLLAACTSTPQPVVGKLHLKALTPVDGVVADALRAKGVTWAEASGPDGVIIDGDYTNSAGIEGMSEINAALQAGKTVIFTDLDNQDDRPGVAKLIGFSRTHDTRGVSYRYERKNGFVRLRVREFPGSYTASGDFEAMPDSGLKQDAAFFVDSVFASGLAAAGLRTLDDGGVPGPVNPIPDGLPYANIQVDEVIKATISGNSKLPIVYPPMNSTVTKSACYLAYCTYQYYPNAMFDQRFETPSKFTVNRVSYNENLWIFKDVPNNKYYIADSPLIFTSPTGLKLNNGYEASDQYQSSVFAERFECTAAFGTKKLIVNFYGFKQVGWNTKWLLGQADNSPLSFSLVQSQPGNVNGQTSLEVSNGFEIGIGKEGPSASYSFETTKNVEIKDWETKNNSNDLRQEFEWNSNNPGVPKIIDTTRTVAPGRDQNSREDGEAWKQYSDFWRQYVVSDYAANTLNQSLLSIATAFAYKFDAQEFPKAVLLKFEMNGLVETGNQFAGSDCSDGNYTIRAAIPTDPIVREYTLDASMVQTRSAEASAALRAAGVRR
jgi:hypothetical protein